MCLITEQTIPEIAKDDFIVYKIFKNRNQSSTEENFLKSQYRGTLFEFGTLYTTQMTRPEKDIEFFDNMVHRAYFSDCDFISRVDELTVIGTGFHSMLNFDRANECSGHTISTIAKCIIPKGAKYYKDKTGLIVSNKIIVHEII